MLNTIDLYTFLTLRGYTNQINEALSDFLEDQGFTGQLSEAFYQYLGSLGYKGALPEKIYQWTESGALVKPVVQITGSPTITSFNSGGTDYTQILFRSDGSMNLTSNINDVSYALVAGGGSGGSSTQSGNGGDGLAVFVLPSANADVA